MKSASHISIRERPYRISDRALNGSTVFIVRNPLLLIRYGVTMPLYAPSAHPSLSLEIFHFTILKRYSNINRARRSFMCILSTWYGRKTQCTNSETQFGETTQVTYFWKANPGVHSRPLFPFWSWIVSLRTFSPPNSKKSHVQSVTFYTHLDCINGIVKDSSTPLVARLENGVGRQRISSASVTYKHKYVHSILSVRSWKQVFFRVWTIVGSPFVFTEDLRVIFFPIFTRFYYHNYSILKKD